MCSSTQNTYLPRLTSRKRAVSAGRTTPALACAFPSAQALARLLARGKVLAIARTALHRSATRPHPADASGNSDSLSDRQPWRAPNARPALSTPCSRCCCSRFPRPPPYSTCPRHPVTPARGATCRMASLPCRHRRRGQLSTCTRARSYVRRARRTLASSPHSLAVCQ